MAITVRNDEFYNLDKDKPMGIHAKQNRAGRWQFRIGDAKGKMVASGMSPAEFARTFWYRDDFTETIEGWDNESLQNVLRIGPIDSRMDSSPRTV